MDIYVDQDETVQVKYQPTDKDIYLIIEYENLACFRSIQMSYYSSCKYIYETMVLLKRFVCYDNIDYGHG